MADVFTPIPVKPMQVDDAAFTPAGTTSFVFPMAAFADEVTPDSVDEGDAGLLRMTLDRKLLTRIVGATDGNRLDVNASGQALVSIAGATATVTVDSELPAAAALADDATNPTTPTVGAALLGFDGTTWDRIYAVADGAAVAAGTKGLIVLGTDGANYQVLKTDANGELQVDVLSGGGEPTPTGPVVDRQQSTNTASAASATFNTAEAAANKLWGVDLAASVAWKAVISMVDNAVNVDKVTLFGKAGEAVTWRAVHRNFFTLGTSAGADNFRVVMTNMDNAQAADLHCTFYYST